MSNNRFYTTLDADTGEAVDLISFCYHKPKTKVLRELILEGLRVRDIRETSLYLTRENRTEEYESEIEKLIEVLSKFLSQTGELNEKDFFTDENTYLLFSMMIYLLDRVLPNLMSELEI